MRGMNYQRHDRRVIEHWSQLGGGCCVKCKNTRKLKHVGVSRVGSVSRNLEQEDDTARERRYTHSLPCEDSRVHGDAVAREQPSNVPRAVAPSNPPPNSHRNEHDVEHPGAKNGADKKGEGLDVQETSIDGPGDGKQSLVSLLDAGDMGWRDAVVQGFGHSHGTVQVQPEAGKKGEHPSEDDNNGKKEVDKRDDSDDDESANITRIPVSRQTYIAVPKVELVSSLMTLFPSSEDALMLLEIFACLESVVHAEHKSLLEELRMDYRLAHSVVEDEKPSTSKSDSDSDESFAHAPKWRPREWWRRISKRVRSSQKKGSRVDDAVVDDPIGVVGSVVENGRPIPEKMDTLVEEVVETQREKATVRFQRHFMRLLKSAQFKGLSVNDLKLTAALNSDYLLTLPIDVDWNSAASADALLFRRGYATERQEGRLFGAKLDYIQSVFLSNFFNGLTGPLFRAGRWCIKKWESLEEDEEGRALAERVERWLEEPLQRAANLKASRSSSDDERSESDVEEGLEIWEAARQAVPRYEAVLSSAGSRGLLIRRMLVRMGLLPPASPRIPDALSQLDQQTVEPYMRPKMLARVSMRDIWRPASKAACGNNPWKQVRAAFSIFFSRSTLQEPAYQELVLLYNQSKSEQGKDEVPGLQLHTYKKIPVPDLKVVFPNKKLSFRLIDTVRLDLASLAGLVAFLVSHKFDDLLSSPSAFVLDLIASVSLIIYVTRVTLGYKQTADRYQLLVNKTLYEKTLASGFGVVHFLLDASEEQLFKGVILVYTLMLFDGRSKSMSTQKIANLCERYLYSNFKEQVEMPMQEIMGTLLRLGLVIEDSTKSASYISVLPDGKAIAALKKQWLALISKQSIWSVR